MPNRYYPPNPGSSERAPVGLLLRRFLGRALLIFSATCGTSVTAGQGWYLMTRPTKYTDCVLKVQPGKERTCAAGDIDRTAPLANWEQLAAYDSARLCESARNELVHHFAEADKKAQAGKTKEQYRAAQDMYLYADARCVASDDPRLKPARAQ